jgi:di/tripeptidase
VDYRPRCCSSRFGEREFRNALFVFAGEHAFHSRLEWVSVQDMEKATQTIVHLAMIREERA